MTSLYEWDYRNGAEKAEVAEKAEEAIKERLCLHDHLKIYPGV